MISPRQQAILAHLATMENQIREAGDPEAVAELDTHGVPWAVDAILGHAPSRSESSSYSRSLRRLRNADFVTLTRWHESGCVSNVKLTDLGREAINQ